MIRGQFSLGILVPRRKVPNNNVVNLPKRTVLIEMYSAKTLVSLIDFFFYSKFENINISLECSGPLQMIALDLCLCMLH